MWTDLSHGLVGWIIAVREGAEKGLRLVEELGEHLAAGVSGEQKVLVTLDDGRSWIPMVVAFEENVVDGVKVVAVRACRVVSGVPPESKGVTGVECVSGDDLESGGLVCAGVGCEDP